MGAWIALFSFFPEKFLHLYVSLVSILNKHTIEQEVSEWSDGPACAHRSIHCAELWYAYPTSTLSTGYVNAAEEQNQQTNKLLPNDPANERSYECLCPIIGHGE